MYSSLYLRHNFIEYYDLLRELSQFEYSVRLVKSVRNKMQFRIELEQLAKEPCRFFVLIDPFEIERFCSLSYRLTKYNNISIHEIFTEAYVVNNGLKYAIDLDIDLSNFKLILDKNQVNVELMSSICGLFTNKHLALSFISNFLEMILFPNLKFLLEEKTKKGTTNFSIYLSVDDNVTAQSKYGIHIILNNYKVNNILFYHELTSELNQIVFGECRNDFFDFHIYKANTSLRTLGSFKSLEKQRKKTKVLVENNKFIPIYVEEHNYLELLKESYLTYVQSIKKGNEIYYNVEVYSKRAEYSTEDFGNETKWNIMNFLLAERNRFGLNSFDIIPYTGSEDYFIYLKRISASICPIHLREHDKANAYIKPLKAKDGDYLIIRLFCFQEGNRNIFMFYTDLKGRPIGTNKPIQLTLNSDPLEAELFKIQNYKMFTKYKIMYDEVYEAIYSSEDGRISKCDNLLLTGGIRYNSILEVHQEYIRLKNNFDNNDVCDVEVPVCDFGEPDKEEEEKGPEEQKVFSNYLICKKDNLFNYLMNDIEISKDRAYVYEENNTFAHINQFSDNKQSERKALILKGPMKLGKTKSLMSMIGSKYIHHYIDKLKEHPIIVILSFRVTFTGKILMQINDAFPQLKLTSYKNPDFLKSRCIVIQVESLWKLKNWQPYISKDKIDLLIVDESESIIEQMSSKLGYNFERTLDMFKYVFNKCQRCIAMDANISIRTVGILQSLGFNSKNTLKINVIGQLCGTKYEIYKNNYDKLKKDIITQVIEERDVNIAIVTNTKILAIKLKEELELLNPHLDIRLIDGETYKGMRSADVEREYNNNIYLTHKVLIYTPTITAGISYELHHYDFIYGLFVSGSCNVEIFIQMLGRIRDIKKIKLYFDNSTFISQEERQMLKDDTKRLSVVDSHYENLGIFALDRESLSTKITQYNDLVNNCSKIDSYRRFVFLMLNTYKDFKEHLSIIEPETEEEKKKSKGALKYMYESYNDQMLLKLRQVNRDKIPEMLDHYKKMNNSREYSFYEMARKLEDCGVLQKIQETTLTADNQIVYLEAIKVNSVLRKIGFVDNNRLYLTYFYRNRLNDKGKTFVNEVRKAYCDGGKDIYVTLSHVKNITKVIESIFFESTLETVKQFKKLINLYSNYTIINKTMFKRKFNLKQKDIFMMTTRYLQKIKIYCLFLLSTDIAKFCGMGNVEVTPAGASELINYMFNYV
jgi:hypothetical protein